MERARIMSIIRRFLLASGFSSPPPDGAKIPRRSTSPPLRATSGPNNSLPPSKNSGFSALDLDAKPSAEVYADASSTATGLMARRRRQRQNRRQRQRDANPAQERLEDLEAAKADAKNPAQERSEDLEADKADASDSKNPASEQESSVDLDEAKPTVSYPKSAASDQELSAKLDTAKHAAPSAELDLDLDAKNRLAAKKRRQRQNQRERERKANNVAMEGEELSAKLDTAKAKAKPTATHLNPLHLEHEHQNSGIVLRPLDPPPIGDRDGLHGAALAVPATSTIGKREVNNELPMPEASAPAAVPPRHPARTRDRPIPATPTAPGLLDDIQGVDSFFFYKRGGLFDQPDENEDRVKHLRYLETCSSLKSSFTYCLACSLSDDKGKHPPIGNDIEKMTKHMQSAHKGGWFKCGKKRCCAMATTLKDINNHRYYAHEL